MGIFFPLVKVTVNWFGFSIEAEKPWSYICQNRQVPCDKHLNHLNQNQQDLWVIFKNCVEYVAIFSDFLGLWAGRGMFWSSLIPIFKKLALFLFGHKLSGIKPPLLKNLVYSPFDRSITHSLEWVSQTVDRESHTAPWPLTCGQLKLVGWDPFSPQLI